MRRLLSRQQSAAGDGQPHTHTHLYHGHRRASFTTTDIDELTELRARQRTFEGAYQRTALGMAVYAIIVLKIFSPAFAKIGILYVVMAALLLVISILRRRRSLHDFADQHRPEQKQQPQAGNIANAEQGRLPTGKRVWGREFRWAHAAPSAAPRLIHRLKIGRATPCTRRTVGNLVMFLVCAVGGLELAIFVQLMKV